MEGEGGKRVQTLVVPFSYFPIKHNLGTGSVPLHLISCLEVTVAFKSRGTR